MNNRKVLTENIIEKALHDHKEDIFMTFSGGKDSLVLLDHVLKQDKGIKVISIDTGYEFPSTIKYIDEIVKERNLNHEYIKPDRKQPVCCDNKKPALNEFLEIRDYYTGWFTGLRADETPERNDVGIYQWDMDGIEKVNPLIHWKEKDIWDYIKKHELEAHPLYSIYRSLGCMPCTEAGKRGKFEDIGSAERDDDSECGLHT